MTTLMFPRMQDKLLRAVGEEISELPVREWDEQALETCLVLFRQMLEHINDSRHSLEVELAGGVEAHSFRRTFGACEESSKEVLNRVRGLIERLSAADDGGSKKLAEAALSLEEGCRAFYDLLSDALARGAVPPRPADAERWRASEDAYARGDVKAFPRN